MRTLSIMRKQAAPAQVLNTTARTTLYMYNKHFKMNEVLAALQEAQGDTVRSL